MKLIPFVLAAVLLVALPEITQAQTTRNTESIYDRLVDHLDLDNAQLSMLHEIRMNEEGAIIATWENTHIDKDEKITRVLNVRIAANTQVNQMLLPDQRLLLHEWCYTQTYGNYPYDTDSYTDALRVANDNSPGVWRGLRPDSETIHSESTQSNYDPKDMAARGM